MTDEIETTEAIETAKNAGCKELVISHCVSSYPAPAKDYNLLTIAYIGDGFQLIAWLSDHTLDNATVIMSIALGVYIIEKHVTLDPNAGSADDSFLLEEMT